MSVDDTATFKAAATASGVTPFGPGSRRSLPMRVIVCGLGRTGTTSMKTALDILGIRAYHSTDLWMDSSENVEQWMRAFDWKYNGKGEPFTRLQWDEILGEYMATVDAPAAFYAAELAELYPDAKVVILNRDKDSWFNSCVSALSRRRSIGETLFFKTLFAWYPRLNILFRYMEKKQRDIWGFEWEEDGAREKAFRFFDEYYADFRARIPAERCLEYHVRDGWDPLCSHLGVALPTRIDEAGELVEIPFPRTNEADQFKAKVFKLRAIAINTALKEWVKALVFGASVGYAVFHIAKPFARVGMFSRWRS